MAKKGTLEGSKALQGGGGFGIQAGVVKVVDNRFKIVQYNSKTSGPVTPMLVHQLDVVKVDEKLEAVDEADVQNHDMLLCWGSKATDENGQHTFRFHPAKASSATDDDPKDLGAEIGAEGNTFCVPDGIEGEVSLFADSDAVLFAMGLEKHGFKAEVNAQAYSPNYNGLIIEVVTVNPDELCKYLGVRYRAPQEGQKPKPQWKIQKIVQMPQDSKSKGAKGGVAKSAAASGGKTNGKAAESGSTEFDVQAYVTDRTKELAKDVKGQQLTKVAFKEAIFKKTLKASNAKPNQYKQIQTHSITDECLGALAGEELVELVMSEDGEQITGVSFPA